MSVCQAPGELATVSCEDNRKLVHTSKKLLRKWVIVDAKAVLADQRPINEYFPQMDPPGNGTNTGPSPGNGDITNQIDS